VYSDSNTSTASLYGKVMGPSLIVPVPGGFEVAESDYVGPSLPGVIRGIC
jgi:hypothetical protein